MVAALLAVSCGELTPPAAVLPTTSSTLATGVEQETASQVQERPGLSAGIDELVPSPGPAYIPSLLVSGSSFVFAVDDGIASPLTGLFSGLRTVRSVDDFGGGLVSQDVSGEIIYRPAQGEAEVLSAADTGDELLDVGFWDGSPRALVQVGPRQVDWIQLITERPGAERQRQVHIELAEGEEVLGLSASGDLQAVIVQNSECGELRFYGSDGQVIPLEGPEPPPCQLGGLPSYGAVSLSHDGGAVAYTLVSYRSDTTEAGTDLIVRELIPGEEAFSHRVGEANDSVTSLTFDGQRAAYLRESGQVQSVTLLNLVDRAELPIEIGQAGEISSVSFARIAVATVG